MKKAKIIALALSLVMACGVFASCGASDTTGASGTAAKTYNVGICQLVQHPALDAATKGFKTALYDKLGDNVKFDEQNAANDAATCATICNSFVSSKVDLMFANATPALQAAAQATGDIPIVATSITDYATALSMKNWSGKTGINVTGTADLAPLDEQAKMVKELIPDAETVGIIYCSAEANSKYQAATITEHFKKEGLEVKEYTFADSNDVASVVTKAVGECDALYCPTDNTVASNAEIINNIAGPAKIPVIAGEEGICKGCGVATLSISYYDIGYKAGEMAYKILAEGANPAEMEIEVSKDLTKKYMADRCKELGIKIPKGYEAI